MKEWSAPGPLPWPLHQTAQPSFGVRTSLSSLLPTPILVVVILIRPEPDPTGAEPFRPFPRGKMDYSLDLLTIHASAPLSLSLPPRRNPLEPNRHPSSPITAPTSHPHRHGRHHRRPHLHLIRPGGLQLPLAAGTEEVDPRHCSGLSVGGLLL